MPPRPSLSATACLGRDPKSAVALLPLVSQDEKEVFDLHHLLDRIFNQVAAARASDLDLPGYRRVRWHDCDPSGSYVLLVEVQAAVRAGLGEYHGVRT